jgi:uncharacterized protein YdaU (DUF1376 family)
MHYYKRNIGDYAKKAGRLTMLQHGAYTLLLDACYDREGFPTLEQAIEWTWASSDAEIDAVKFVLARFFTLSQDNEYVQNRILEEILVYHKNADTNKRIALERETKRKQNSTNRATDSTKREQPVDEAPPNHKPLTINHKPILKDIAPPDGVLESVWQDFVKQRKAKKAAITQTAVKSIEREARKAGISLNDALQEICARGWTGFKAEWMAKNNLSFAERDEQARRKRWEEMSGRKWTETNEIDITPTTLEIEE